MKYFAYGFLSILALIGSVLGFLWWFLEREKKAYRAGCA